MIIGENPAEMMWVFLVYQIVLLFGFAHDTDHLSFFP